MYVVLFKVHRAQNGLLRCSDSADQGFLHCLDLTMHDKTVEKARLRTNWELQTGDNDEADSLLDASDVLVKLNRRARSAVTDAANAPDCYASYEQTGKVDKDRVKNILATGKRVFEREINGLEHGTKATKGSDEITAQANAIFVGHRKQNDENADVSRSLKYMEKGVKKMTKGLDSDV